MNKPEYVIIHHSLTKDSETVSWAAIRKFHVEEYGWYEIGYHYGIEMVGTRPMTFYGRREMSIGAHCKEMSMNKRSIGICVVGNYDLSQPDNEILIELVRVVWAVKVAYAIPTDRVLGHREVGKMAGYDWTKGEYKTCPGRKFSMTSFRKMLRGEP